MTRAVLLLCLALASALPMSKAAPAASPGPVASDDDRPEIIEIIAPANNAQETLATLSLGAPGSDLGDRNKRTIGILRQLFPTLTQIIEQKVQQITSSVLQTFGPVVLRAFLGNRNGNDGGTGGNGEGGGTVELDDDDDEEDSSPPPPPPPPSPSPATTPPSSPSPTTTDAPDATDATEADAPERRRRRSLHFVPNGDENQLLSGAESQQAEVRVAFGEGDAQAPAQASDADQQTAAQTNSAAIDEISLDDSDTNEENRNKRFLSFGGAGGSSGGGSGNFLFDIVRRPAQMAAQAVGAAARLWASTGSLQLGLEADHSHSRPQLVAGSSSGSSGAAGGDAEGEDAGAAGAGKGDNLTEGVPGPITRLFIIANRGIANLIQDLILRLAQTSERIVNFKARLITSII